MRMFRCFTLLLALLAPAVAFADGLYHVELILFRQAGEQVLAGKVAPDDWAAGAQNLAPESVRDTTLNSEAAKLTPGSGYQVLLHQAWQQNLSATPSRVALTSGEEKLQHFAVEGTVSLQQARFTDIEADLWINQFDANGLVIASERLKQGTRLKNGELTFLDNGSLGLLVKISPR